MSKNRKYIVACIKYGECPAGCEYTYGLFQYLDVEDVYYMVEEIYKIYFDDHNDYFTIYGNVGEVKYNLDISYFDAAMDYLNKCCQN